MKIVNIIGGLGNQMFQYAFAVSLKNKFPEEEVMIDTSHYNHLFINRWKSANLHNGFEINSVFPNANIPIATSSQIKRVSRYIPNYILSRFFRKCFPVKNTEIVQNTKDYFAYDPLVYEQKGDCYYEGIWESVQYINPIRKLLKHVYKHPQADGLNKYYIELMEKENSIGIHIRRGDYLYAEEFCNICDLEYYRKAIDTLLKDGLKHLFFIFSNDMLWCEENIIPLLGDNQIILVTHNKEKNSCWDMFLMTHCKDLIIANSSFSWWGAFLNHRNGRVLSPDKWVNRDAVFDIWPEDWVRISSC